MQQFFAERAGRRPHGRPQSARGCKDCLFSNLILNPAPLRNPRRSRRPGARTPAGHLSTGCLWVCLEPTATHLLEWTAPAVCGWGVGGGGWGGHSGSADVGHAVRRRSVNRRVVVYLASGSAECKAASKGATR
jgi:hypothetical protein